MQFIDHPAEYDGTAKAGRSREPVQALAHADEITSCSEQGEFVRHAFEFARQQLAQRGDQACIAERVSGSARIEVRACLIVGGDSKVGTQSCVQPRTSKGITDLLLLNLGWLNATCPSKKLGDADRSGVA